MPVLAALDALDDELIGEHGLARAGGPGDQHRVAAGDAAAHHLVEARHAGREAMLERVLGDDLRRLEQAGEDAEAGRP